jgi:hypothetical protein
MKRLALAVSFVVAFAAAAAAQNIQVVFHVQDPQGTPVPNAFISAKSPHGDWQAVTDANGNFDSGAPEKGLGLTPGDYLITVSKPGFKDRVLETPTKPAHLESAGTIVTALESASSPLAIRGRDFIDANGQRQVFIGTDEFTAFRQYLDGGEPAIQPLIDESHAFGFNLWRVFFMGSKAQNSILELRPSDPGFYTRVRPFVDFLNRNGIVLLAEVYVDNEDVHAGYEHWVAMNNLFRGTLTIVSGGNEFAKNGFDPGQLADPGPDVVWSRGSNLSDAAPFMPNARVALFHPRRDLPAMLYDSVASAGFLYDHGINTPLGADEPIGAADQTIPGKRSADPVLWWQLGRAYSTFWAFAVFHNDYGMRGELMSPTVRECARAFVRGMRIQ